MKDGEFWVLSHLGDDELESELVQLLVNGSRTEARILAHLAAVEERRLHLEAGNRSLFDYCCKRLGLSENEAFHRITAARLARRFPLIFSLIERRAIHLTAVCLLRDYLTPNNHRELLAEASGKTKLQVQELLARRFPRPDVASTIRKLPALRDASARDTPARDTPARDTPARDTPARDTPARDTPARDTPTPDTPTRDASARDTPARDTPARDTPARDTPTRDTPTPDTPAPLALAFTEQSSTSTEAVLARVTLPSPSTSAESGVTSKPQTPAPTARPSSPPRNVVVEPLSAARYRIQLNASPQLKQKLEQARDLLSHSNPSGDLATVIERALDVLLERTLKQRFAQTNRPRPARGADRTNAKTSTNSEGNAESALEATRQRRTRRSHIANANKREVVARDGLRCTFVGRDGQRCGATLFTQIHHEQPWARHGNDSPRNLRILCASHNRLLAERDFGREFVAERIPNRRVSPGASPG